MSSQVSGDSTESVHVEVVAEGRLSLDRAVDWVECPRSGAIATFSGVVRDNSDGRQVDHLDYEAYVPMAVKVMRSIGERIVKERGVSKIFMAHRVGRLQVKEPAVVIAVSAPHRAEAIGASRLAIDELKLQVPIFKKEVFVDGSHWKSNRP
ncbi:molybdopterin biosynthesis protein MoaE [Chloropicon roscoffensis]|uniref:Molybdopterin biosynthesis protein MoaE n=1 Tax=Chloropicon roscoffensis TaxID=1461544 RepID=A0A7S3CDZ9_9CHLO|mmetsp:Transcript_45/g.156  ORF Transcript_45/g.156 Transcript_45/m.156 type:complete len:151 (+) Transcript_45:203-655(+)